MNEPASPTGKEARSDVAPAAFRAELGTLDFTLLVIGAIVGAVIYIVAAMGAQFLGPAQLVAWLAAGVLGALMRLPLSNAPPSILRWADHTPTCVARLGRWRG